MSMIQIRELNTMRQEKEKMKQISGDGGAVYNVRVPFYT